MENDGISWKMMEYHGISWKMMEYHGISWNIMEYHGISGRPVGFQEPTPLTVSGEHRTAEPWPGYIPSGKLT